MAKAPVIAKSAQRISVAQLRQLGGLSGLFKTFGRRGESRRGFCRDGGLSEESEQRILADRLLALEQEWLLVRGRRLVWAASANGSKRHRGAAGALKAQGVKPGFPDVMIYTTPPFFPQAKGLAIELKREKVGRLSEEQKCWAEDLRAEGWLVVCCHGCEQAWAWVRRGGYLGEGEF